jgi:hypothetical protein
VIEPAKIPGMIEPCEQTMLTELASSEFVANNGSIVEFGCFFGRSTGCLVNGAQGWWDSKKGPAVYAFDSFSCADGDGFAPHVWGFANRAGVGHLVRRDDRRVDFYPVYQHYVGEAERSGLLSTSVVELRDATFSGDRISLMHLDAPKHYPELKYIMVRFFPALVAGGSMIFQDFFYHWSATVIAAVQLMVEAGWLRLERSAASALVTTVLRTPTAQDLLDLDLAMATASIADTIDRSLQTLKSVQIDRPEQFVPRVHLAKVQYLWEAGDTAAAQMAFQQMINQTGGGLSRSVFSDFSELMRYGFSIRKLYELDHKA